jgi:hypothetical protein
MPASPVLLGSFLLLIALPVPPALAQDDSPITLLNRAEDALRARRPAEAAEQLERAEARLLTRGELASVARRPATGGAIGDLAAARDALARGDRLTAASLIGSARRRLEQGEGSQATPPDAPPDDAAPDGAPKDPRALPVAKPPTLR